MVDFDLNELFPGLVLSEGESDGDVRKILRQFACARTGVSAMRSFPLFQSLHASGEAALPLGPSTVMMRERI